MLVAGPFVILNHIGSFREILDHWLSWSSVEGSSEGPGSIPRLLKELLLLKTNSIDKRFAKVRAQFHCFIG